MRTLLFSVPKNKWLTDSLWLVDFPVGLVVLIHRSPDSQVTFVLFNLFVDKIRPLINAFEPVHNGSPLPSKCKQYNTY